MARPIRMKDRPSYHVPKELEVDEVSEQAISSQICGQESLVARTIYDHNGPSLVRVRPSEKLRGHGQLHGAIYLSK